MMSAIDLTIDAIHALAKRCLLANGCDDANAHALADCMSVAERDGSHAHGLFRVPGYVAALRSGKVDGCAAAQVERLAPGVLRVDARGGFAPLALRRGRPALIECAREQGIAAQAYVNMHHFSSLWIETEALAEAGLVAFACTAYMPAVAPSGGCRPLYGTNPIAFAWPRADKPPMVFDMATAAMSRGDIQIAARDGKSIPPGAGLDAQGNATTDPQAVLDGGVMLTFGGYKGSALAMMVELLAAGLLGQAFSFEAKQRDNGDGGPPAGGEFIFAMDPARFGDPDWAAHCEGFFEQYGAIAGTRLPGDRRYRERARHAAEPVPVPVPVPRDLYERIVALC